MKVVVIDDDPQNLKMVQFVLADEQLEIHAASSPQSGFELVCRVQPQVVLLDLVMPGVQGMELLQKILDFDPGIDVILMTGYYSTESAVEAIQKGASDYLPKPLSTDKLLLRIRQISEEAKRRQRSLSLDNDLVENFEFEGMIGRSPLMLDLFSRVRRIAPHFQTVLITGATGVGKELVAKALHTLSPAARGPFVALNCSSISETLAESELFGHVKGAFTGADQNQMGIFEYAEGGTAALDEIGEMPLSMQAKLLRVLQNHEFQRVGSPAPRKANVRVVALTNRDLRALVGRGSFREDLYFRLSMVELRVPSLAERPEDLPLLERHFLRHFATEYKKTFSGLTRRTQAALARYSWPGNVRELQNVIGHACMMSASEFIDIRDLPDALVAERPRSTTDVDSLMSMREVDRLHAQHVLDRVGGNKVKAAEILGISRTHLYQLLKDAGQEREEEQEHDKTPPGRTPSPLPGAKTRNS
ncbi:MAG TPA: sigma-54 dependent transcriptional regulator [Candidatus Cybelea sp.]|nr:sigma-54 dependent transcriptional regulator [Candidatus Cybelea sp.]